MDRRLRLGDRRRLGLRRRSEIEGEQIVVLDRSRRRRRRLGGQRLDAAQVEIEAHRIFRGIDGFTATDGRFRLGDDRFGPRRFCFDGLQLGQRREGFGDRFRFRFRHRFGFRQRLGRGLGHLRNGRRHFGGRRLPGLSVQRIGRIEAASEFGHLGPVRTPAAGLRVKFRGQRVELLHGPAIGINLEQLGVDRGTPLILLQRLEQDFLGLRVAAVGHVNIGLGDRIDLVGIDRSRTGLAEIAGLRCRVAGIDALPPGHPESRAVARTTGGGIGRRFDGRVVDTAPLVQRIAGQQRDDRSATGQRQRIFEQRVEQFGFRFRRRRRRNRLFRRFGRRRRRSRRRHRRLDRLGRFCGFGSRLGRYRRFHWRRRGRRLGGFGFRLRRLLHVGQHPVLHLEQFLQVVDLFLEHRQALLRLLQGLVLGQALGFLGGRCRRQVGTRDLDLVPRLLGRQLLFVDPGRDLAAAGLAGRLVARRALRRGRRQFLAIGIPVPGMGRIDFPGLFGRNGFDARPVRQIQDAARLQAVDVASGEGIRVVLEQADQHLLQRNALVLRFAGDPAQGLALPDGMLLAGFLALRRNGLGCRGLARGKRPGLDGAAAANRIDDTRFGDLASGLLDRNFRRIEQEGVFADQSATRPAQFDQEIEERLVDRTRRTQLDDRVAAGPLLEGKAQIMQRRHELDARLPEDVPRSEASAHPAQFVARRADFEFGTQRLPQPGQHGQFAEARRFGDPGRERQAGGDSDSGRTFAELDEFSFVHGETLGIDFGSFKLTSWT